MKSKRKMIKRFDIKLEKELCEKYGFDSDELKEIMRCVNRHCSNRSVCWHYALNPEDMKMDCLNLILKEYPKHPSWEKKNRVNGIKWLVKNYIKSIFSFHKAKKRVWHSIRIEECEDEYGLRLDFHKIHMKDFRDFLLMNCSEEAFSLYCYLLRHRIGDGGNTYGMRREMSSLMGVGVNKIDKYLAEIEKYYHQFFRIPITNKESFCYSIMENIITLRKGGIHGK